MSIASEINRITGIKSDIANAITAKGRTVNSGDGLADFAAAIIAIPNINGITFGNLTPTSKTSGLTLDTGLDGVNAIMVYSFQSMSSASTAPANEAALRYVIYIPDTLGGIPVASRFRTYIAIKTGDTAQYCGLVSMSGAVTFFGTSVSFDLTKCSDQQYSNESYTDTATRYFGANRLYGYIAMRIGDIG